MVKAPMQISLAELLNLAIVPTWGYFGSESAFHRSTIPPQTGGGLHTILQPQCYIGQGPGGGRGVVYSLVVGPQWSWRKLYKSRGESPATQNTVCRKLSMRPAFTSLLVTTVLQPWVVKSHPLVTKHHPEPITSGSNSTGKKKKTITIPPISISMRSGGSIRRSAASRVDMTGR